MKATKNDLYILEKKADILCGAGKYEEALKLYNKLTDENTLIHDKHLVEYAYIKISMIHNHRKEYDLALEVLMDAYKIAPKSGYVNFMIGQAYYSRGEDEKAINYLSESLRVLPGNYHGIKLLCWIYEHRKDYDSINKVLKRAVNNNPLNGELCMRYASSILSLENKKDKKSLEEALQYLDKAFSLGLRDPLISFLRGRAYFFLEQWGKCISLLENYLSITNNRDPAVIEMLVYSAGASGDLDKAESYALELAKEDPERGAKYLKAVKMSKAEDS